MPIYDLRCKKCRGLMRDQYLPITASLDEIECAHCGHRGVERVPVRSSFRLHNERCGGFTNNSSKTPSAG